MYIYIAISHVMLCFAENSFYDQANTNRWLNKKKSENFRRLCFTTTYLHLLSSSEKSRGATSHGNILPELPLCNFCNMNINKIDCSTDKVDVRIFKKRSRSLKTRKPTTIKVTIALFFASNSTVF